MQLITSHVRLSYSAHVTHSRSRLLFLVRKPAFRSDGSHGKCVRIEIRGLRCMHVCGYDERQSSGSMHEEKFGLESAFQNLINLVWRQVHHRRATPFFLQPWRFPFMHIIPFIQRVYIYIYTLSVPQEIIVLYF